MDRSTPGLPVHHHLPELAQTHSIELVMPSNQLIVCRPLLFLFPNLSPHQGLFQGVGSSHQGAKVQVRELRFRKP